MAEIEFRDPPPKYGRGVWIERLAPLLEHEGRWAVVLKGGKPPTVASNTSNLRKGRYQIPPGRWEFRAVDDEIFARYLGPEETPALRGVS